MKFAATFFTGQTPRPALALEWSQGAFWEVIWPLRPALDLLLGLTLSHCRPSSSCSSCWTSRRRQAPCWPPKVLGTSQQGPCPCAPPPSCLEMCSRPPWVALATSGEISSSPWSGMEVWPVAGPLSWWGPPWPSIRRTGSGCFLTPPPSPRLPSCSHVHVSPPPLVSACPSKESHAANPSARLASPAQPGVLPRRALEEACISTSFLSLRPPQLVGPLGPVCSPL